MENNFKNENFAAEAGAEVVENKPEEPQEIEAPEAEKPLVERQLSPEEVGDFKNEMDGYTEGLRVMVAELKTEQDELRQMSSEADGFVRMQEINDELADLEEQIAGLSDSSEAIDEARDAAVITLKK